MRRWVVLLAVPLIAVLIMAAAEGYVVVLKNGSRIRAREPLKIEGRNAIITLVTGTLTSLPIDQVDLVATERYNQLGLGSALIIDELNSETPVPTSTPRISLGHYASIDMEDNPELGTAITPSPTPTPGIRLQTVPYADQRMTKAFSQLFEDKHFYVYRLSAGTRPNYFFVQAVTDSQNQVFEALQVITEAYSVIEQVDPASAPAALEIELVSSGNKRAGTFRLTPDQANELASGAVSVEKFYIDHVIF